MNDRGGSEIMNIEFGREICGDLSSAEAREWLVTNGIGGYASGTVAGLLTRRYHGLLVAALQPPLGRTLLLTKLDETVEYDKIAYALHTNRWADGNVEPHGYRHIESFELEGTIPTWKFACADALLEKQIWMQHGANTTYVRYTLSCAAQPLTLTLKALVNYRDYHGSTQGNDWQMNVEPIDRGIKIAAYDNATPLYLSSDTATATPAHNWHHNFDLAVERYRGLSDREDHLHSATFTVTLNPGESIVFVASTDPQPNLDGAEALKLRHNQEQKLINLWKLDLPNHSQDRPAWIDRLVLAADQFIVDRPLPDALNGKTIIAGYHWFGDWGRDTMISLPGLKIATGRTEIARSILLTFAKYVVRGASALPNRGMLPNRFPDAGDVPEYNTVDATLWYFEAIRSYYDATADDDLLAELFPVLAEMIDWHCRSTRYNIHLDASDGLLNPTQNENWSFRRIKDILNYRGTDREAENRMLKLNLNRWNQSIDILRGQAMSAEHPRTRERWMALYEIGIGKNATKVGTATGRNPQTVMEWVHRYNEIGPEAMVFKQTGGHPPLCPKQLKLK
jgi:predicted glycogen debranching enzyme